MIVLSLFDFTGEMVKPWAAVGYECICVDIQHPVEGRFEENISYIRMDLGPASEAWDLLYDMLKAEQVAMVIGFPVCTDLALSGAKHWEAKRAVNQRFQENAAAPFFLIEALAKKLGAPYMMENPKSRAEALFRPHDHEFNPYEYGGYLTTDDVHPFYPEHIPPRDAYEKLTYIWDGNGFIMPFKRPVVPQFKLYRKGNGKILKVSKIVAKTGGSSLKTKNIRSATPRGYAIAVFVANGAERERTQTI